MIAGKHSAHAAHKFESYFYGGRSKTRRQYTFLYLAELNPDLALLAFFTATVSAVPNYGVTECDQQETVKYAILKKKHL